MDYQIRDVYSVVHLGVQTAFEVPVLYISTRLQNSDLPGQVTIRRYLRTQTTSRSSLTKIEFHWAQYVDLNFYMN